MNWSATLAWRVQIDDRAARDIRKLDRDEQHRILSFLRKRVAIDEDPRRFGQPLTGSKTGLWRYRVGSYRLICRIEDAQRLRRQSWLLGTATAILALSIFAAYGLLPLTIWLDTR